MAAILIQMTTNADRRCWLKKAADTNGESLGESPHLQQMQHQTSRPASPQKFMALRL